jgi:hypothetical protein
MIRTIYREKDRETCGVWMPKAQDHCARIPGHDPRYGHRSAYSLDNLRAKRRPQPVRLWRCPGCGRP